MTKDQLDSVKSIAFTLADGVAVVFPIAAPAIKIVEDVINTLETAGLASVVMTEEQATAIAAGMAAAKAAAVQEYVRAHGVAPTSK